MGEERETFEAEGVEYEIRQLPMPDGSVSYLACTPGGFDHLTDEELVAELLALLADQDDQP
ncbi:hypothetical protein [Streptomyces capuensis]|uniref:hypothetical protein n=1 Tax=Streptomyces capuensis TaxID=1464056 RepID=UPI0004BE4970|nr:hypothetical protein [Streptomyces capuensis]